jgi:preprotein translocase subunit SecG
MALYQYILGSVLIVLAVLVVAIILMQEGRRQGIQGAISGGADTFLSRNKARSLNAKLARFTKWIAIIFFALILTANILAVVLTK